jgi:hypothetical protein
MSSINPHLRRLAGAGLTMLMGVAIVSLVEAGQQRGEERRQRAQSVRGIVDDVDPDARALMVRPSEGPTQRVLYTEETAVSGARGGVAGLAVVEGRQVIVQFTMQRATRVASSIELLPQR